MLNLNPKTRNIKTLFSNHSKLFFFLINLKSTHKLWIIMFSQTTTASILLFRLKVETSEVTRYIKVTSRLFVLNTWISIFRCHCFESNLRTQNGFCQRRLILTRFVRLNLLAICSLSNWTSFEFTALHHELYELVFKLYLVCNWSYSPLIFNKQNCIYFIIRRSFHGMKITIG